MASAFLGGVIEADPIAAGLATLALAAAAVALVVARLRRHRSSRK